MNKKQSHRFRVTKTYGQYCEEDVVYRKWDTMTRALVRDGYLTPIRQQRRETTMAEPSTEKAVRVFNRRMKDAQRNVRHSFRQHV